MAAHICLVTFSHDPDAKIIMKTIDPAEVATPGMGGKVGVHHIDRSQLPSFDQFMAELAAAAGVTTEYLPSEV
jgi:hypothetical protein